MRDVVYVAIVVGFFGLCAAYVGACARIVGGAAPGAAVPVETDEGEAEGAPALAVVPGGGGPAGAAR